MFFTIAGQYCASHVHETDRIFDFEHEKKFHRDQKYTDVILFMIFCDKLVE